MTHIETLKLALEEMRRLARLANVDHSENAGVVALEQAIAEAEQAQAVEHCIWARNGNTPCPHTTPPRQPEQACSETGVCVKSGRYCPPRQPWVGLTDEEREAIADEYQSSVAAALMSEAKLKEKNT